MREHILSWVKQLLFIVESRVTRARRRLTVDTESKIRSLPLRQAKDCLYRLFEDDSFFFSSRYASVSPEDAKKLFLYSGARQVFKACAQVIEYEDYLLEVPNKAKVETIERTVLESIIDRQSALLRKQLELLVNLVCFSIHDPAEFYRIFLNAENLEYFLGRQADQDEFFGSRSGNVDVSISDFRSRMREDITSVGNVCPWFLRRDWQTSKVPPVFASLRNRFKKALKFATDEERLILGVSYHSIYSTLSMSVHPSAGSLWLNRIELSNIIGNIDTITIANLHIMSRINKLLGHDDPQDVGKMMGNGSDAPFLVRQWKKTFGKGDIVLAIDHLAEIVECTTSPYGYVSCRVRYLSGPPLQETPEDWLQTPYIKSILPKSKVRTFLLRDLNNPGTKSIYREALKLMEKETDEELMSYAKGAILKLHQEGLLIPMLRRNRSFRSRHDIND